MIDFAAERLMQLETEGICNLAPGEHSVERSNHWNCYRDGDWDTRAGMVENCASRSCAKAATSKGISTRSVDDLVKAMGMDGISKSQVSRVFRRS
jgi:putative transposase